MRATNIVGTLAVPSTASAADAAAGRQRALSALVGRIAHGDHDALAHLYDLTSATVFGRAIRLLRRSADAEEVTFDVYLQVWRRASTYDAARGTVEAWLVTTTRNRAIDRLRAARVRHEDRVEPLAGAGPVSPYPGPDVAAERQDDRVRVRQALAAVPVSERTLIELAFFRGLTHADLARRLGLPLGTVKTRVRRGLQRLHVLLQPAAS